MDVSMFGQALVSNWDTERGIEELDLAHIIAS